MIRALCLLAPILGVVAACSDDAPPPITDAAPDGAVPQDPLFPANYAASYQEVRNCRKSGDHDLNFIKVFVDGNAAGPYMDRVTAFPDGAVVLKEEYDLADSDCSGDITQWTVMVKDAAATELNGWRWQEVSATREVTEQDDSRCYGCHELCDGVSPHVGYDFTCTDP